MTALRTVLIRGAAGLLLLSGAGCSAHADGSGPATSIAGPRAQGGTEPGGYGVIRVEPDAPLGPFTITDEGVSLSPQVPGSASPGRCLELNLVGATFESDQAELTPAGGRVVDALVARLAPGSAPADGLVCSDGQPRCAIADVDIAVHGHTDPRPTSRPGGNDQLSLDRAAAVTGRLQAAGLRTEPPEGNGARVPPPEPPGGWPDQATALAAARRVTIELRCVR